METQVRKSPHPLMWMAGIAITLFSAAGIAAIMGWIPISTGTPSEKIAASKAATAPAKHTAKRTQAVPAQVAVNAPAKAYCADCGVIESIRELEARGEGSGIGVVGGAVVGGLLGNQVGGGSGKKIATVAGVVGGAVAGNEIEKRVKTSKSYEITVRFEDGSSRVIADANPPAWRIGDRVRVINGMIQSNA